MIPFVTLTCSWPLHLFLSSSSSASLVPQLQIKHRLSDLCCSQNSHQVNLPSWSLCLKLCDLLHPGSKYLSRSSIPLYFYHCYLDSTARKTDAVVDKLTVKLHCDENAPAVSNPSIRHSGIESVAVFVLAFLSASQVRVVCWSGNCCAVLSLYLIQQSHHLGCRAPRFLSQSGPKLSWQGRKREGEIDRCTLNSAPSPQDNSISDLSPFVHPSVVYQRTKALERKIR